MGNSISTLIEIYENELSDLLLQSGRDYAQIRLSKTPIPKIEDIVKLSNSDFTIKAVERFTDVSKPRSMMDFLNDEDKKIIHELESESEGQNIQIDGEFDDDPYPEIEIPNYPIWELEGDEDTINIDEDEAEYLNENGEVKWQMPDTPDDRETTIAYYRSFHSAGPAFGIYYRRNGLMQKTRTLYRFCQQQGYRISIAQTYVIAKLMTQVHEIYHHKIEAIASRIEVISRLPIYKNGFSRWYSQTRGNIRCYEETFANLYAYQKTINALSNYLPKTALHNIMIYWFRQQPPPYRNALRLINQKEEIKRQKESEFFEIILKKFFPTDRRFGKQYAKVWSLFTHGTHPFINTNSNVYYIV